MPYLIANKILFFHTPKTGGSFVFDIFRKNIQEIGHRHDTPDMIDSGAYKITFVREPVSWWESYWNWKNKDWDHPEGRELNYQPTQHFYEYKSNSIYRFVRKVYQKEPAFLTKMFNKYTQVDKVYRYEEIHRAIYDIVLVCDLDISYERIIEYRRVNPGHIHDKIVGRKTIELIKNQEKDIYEKYY